MTDNNKNTTKRLKIIIGLLALIVLFIVGLLWLRKSDNIVDSSATQASYTVQRRNLKVSVTESGNISALHSVDIRSQVEGQTTILSIVPEGTIITPEDVKNKKVLVELDSSKLKESLTQQKISFASAQANYTEAQESYDIQKKQNESNISAAELKCRFALMDLQKYLGENTVNLMLAATKNASSADKQKQINKLVDDLRNDPNDPRWAGGALQNKRKLETDIELANEEFQRAKNKLEGTQKLYKNKYVAYADLESDRMGFSRAKIQLQQAKTAMALFLKYDFPKQTEQLFSDYQEAQRSLLRTEAQARSQLAQSKAKLNSSQSTYLLQKSHLEKVQAQIAACTIRATSPGLVVYGTSGSRHRYSEQPIDVGTEVYQRQRIITIPDTSAMAVDIQVHEAWVDKVKKGQKAIITVDAFPDKILTGHVIRIAFLPDSQRSFFDTGMKVYSTKVAIDGKQNFLKPGMSAKVEIIINNLQNVLCIPLQAVTSIGTDKYCYVIGPAGLEKRKIITGSFNESFIEVIKGLHAGEKVSLVPPRWTEKSNETKNNKKAKSNPKNSSGIKAKGYGSTKVMPTQSNKGATVKNKNAASTNIKAIKIPAAIRAKLPPNMKNMKISPEMLKKIKQYRKNKAAGRGNIKNNQKH